MDSVEKIKQLEEEIERLKQALAYSHDEVESLLADMRDKKVLFFKAAQEAIENNFVDGNAKWPWVKGLIESRFGADPVPAEGQ